MKLLFVTQVMDKHDDVLGAYHAWVAELATRFEHIEVICLREGEHALPDNVRVHSLGKEKAEQSSVVYAIRFLKLVWALRHEYDVVFVHMNQEYILLAGKLWKVLGKRIYLYRNHYAGSWLTDIAALFCTKVFCTSKHSYTAKYKKMVLMPVGVDTERFHADTGIKREPHSILFLARIAPSKRPDLFIDALGILLARGVSFIASVYGSPQPADVAYYESLKARAESLGLHDRVRFHAGVPNEKASAVFSAHEIFVNCSPSGMFDKTLFEAAASGCAVVAQSDDWNEGIGQEMSGVWDAEALASRLEAALSSGSVPTGDFVEANSLSMLVDRLAQEIL